MSKIIGNTTATPNPRPDWNQIDENRADYIKNKPVILTEVDVINLIEEHSLGGEISKIQSDWNQTDDTKVDYIKNKPEIPSLEGFATEEFVEQQIAEKSSVQADWTQEDSTQLDYIKNKPIIPSVEGLATEQYVDEALKNTVAVQSDWAQTDETAADYIKNKPTSFDGQPNLYLEGIIGIDGNTVDEIIQSKIPEGGYNSGDIFIIKTLILDDKHSYTAYVYDGAVWKAMDGNYNAENVYFDENIIITSAIGNIELSNGSGEIPAAGKNLKQVFEAIWTKEMNPSVTLPTVTITTDVQYKEIGTSVVPLYNAVLNPGSYAYGPETGITAQTWSVTWGDRVKTSSYGVFPDLIVTEGDCFKITATATYNDGTIPVTNLGNNCEEKQIKAGSASISKSLVIGYKPNFYGFKTEAIDINQIDSDIIRTLGVNQEFTATPVSSVTSATSWMQFFYAIPKGHKTSLNVKDSNNLPLTVKTKEVTVKHVGEVLSTYVLFYIDNDAPYGATTLTLTWK